MDSGHHSLQPFNIDSIEDITEEILTTVDLEPHPILLETREEELSNMRRILFRAFQRFHNPTQNLYGSVLISEIQGLQTIKNAQLRWHGDQIQWFDESSLKPILNISQNRQLFIHRCIYCDTQDESKGMDTYNIVCDECGTKVLRSAFLNDEDCRYETLILEE